MKQNLVVIFRKSLVFGIVVNIAFAQLVGAEDLQTGEIPTPVQMVANCPTISDLEFVYKFGDNTQLYQFRYQSNGFFARITKSGSFQGEFALQDTVCGRWGDNYWQYSYVAPPAKDAPPVPPILFKYKFNSKDIFSIAYSVVNKNLLTRFRLFQTLGIAGDSSPGELSAPGNNQIVYKNLVQQIITFAQLNYSNGVPVSADLKITTPDGMVHKQGILYQYSPYMGQGMVPSRIEGVGFTIQVIELSFGGPLPEEYFTPPQSLLTLKDLQTIIHSNYTDYVYSRDGQLVATYNEQDRIRSSQVAEIALRSGLPLDQVAISTRLNWSRIVVLVLFAISAVVLIIIVKKLWKDRTN